MGTFDFDVAVIGGGSAGYATARTTAAAGQRTVVIAAGEELGGLCILRGCMPTKALLHAADVRHQARRSKLWGLEPGEVGFDFPAVMRRKAAMVEEFASYRRSQLQDGRFELIRALARFRDPHTLELDNGQTVTAGNIMISTGSRVADLPMPGLAKLGCMTSDDALQHESLPQSIVVLGGGAVAVEFAQFFARFDARVTLLQRSPHILKACDDDVAGEVEAAFRDEGITVHTGCSLIDARQDDDEKLIVYKHNGGQHEVRAEAVFHGLGRSPNTDSLALKNAGVETEHGRIICDTHMRTSTPHIFAGGDCPFNDHGKSIIMDAMHGFVKLLCDPRSGEILGGACVGPMGGELIHEIVTAMAKRMTVAELANMPHYHPTLAEIWTYPADDLAEEIVN